MLRLTLGALLLASFAAGAQNVETLTERSQARARAVLDKAVEAVGGAEALQAIEAVELRLEGQTWTRLQMPTPEPPFEPGTLRNTAARPGQQPPEARAARARRRLRGPQHRADQGR
jgi:hypothetical protein